jgi:hypothetical protein
MNTRFPFDPTTVHDPSTWQPLRYADGSGNPVTQGFVGAQWQQATTFALSPRSLRAADRPAGYGSADYRAQAQALLDLSAGLTDEQKMIAKYWADGPHSELPPGHRTLFAQFVSRRDHHGGHEYGIERDVKLFFADVFLRDRRPVVRLPRHREVPCPAHLPQAGRLEPGAGGEPGPGRYPS